VCIFAVPKPLDLWNDEFFKWGNEYITVALQPFASFHERQDFQRSFSWPNKDMPATVCPLLHVNVQKNKFSKRYFHIVHTGTHFLALDLTAEHILSTNKISILSLGLSIYNT
jgi:hypothetical protein